MLILHCIDPELSGGLIGNYLMKFEVLKIMNLCSEGCIILMTIYTETFLSRKTSLAVGLDLITHDINC